MAWLATSRTRTSKIRTQWLGLSLALLPVSAAVAQCSRPPLPTVGLAVTEAPDRIVTYGDGDRTTGRLVYPTLAPPSCGWPLIVFVHGLGADRRETPAVRRGLAARGYAVWSYDVRGQGSMRTLNSSGRGLTFYGAREKVDLAEQIGIARRSHPVLVSRHRVAVVGSSQGAVHAWAAAAFAGKTLTEPGRPAVVMPSIDAVVARHFVAEPIDQRLPGGTRFGSGLIGFVADPPNPAYTVDAAFRAQVRAAFLADDAAGLLRAWSQEPFRPVRSALAASAVPVLYQHAWLDTIGDPSHGLAALRSMPASTRRRAILSTGGHGSPINLFELAFQDELISRWLDRFCWNAPHTVAAEAGLLTAPLPTTASLRQSAQSLWGQRYDPLVPTDTVTETLHAHDDGVLRTMAPSAVGAPTTIRHAVSGGLTAAVWLADPMRRTVSSVLTSIPLSQRSFTLAPLPAERELAGAPRIEFTVVPSAPRFGLSALLRVKTPDGEQTDLGHGGVGVVDGRVGRSQRLAFDLSETFAVLPAGAVLELVVRNHWQRGAGQSPLVAVPHFQSSTVSVHHGPGADSARLDLVWRQRVRADLRTPVTTLAHPAPPASIPLVVSGGSAAAGQPYFLALGVSGHALATPIPTTTGALHLTRDPLTDVMLGHINGPLLGGFAGTLDLAGRATADLRVGLLAPLPRELRDARLTVTGWVHRSLTDLSGQSTNPIDLWFR